MDQKLLDIEGIVSGSSSINQESSNLTEVCASLYSLVTSLRENEDFKTMVASSEYFGSIDILNQQVPRYAEALLQFSKFLSNYVLENYSDTDAEMKAKVEANLAEAIAKLGETDETVGTSVDYSKISTTAAGALSGDFIDSSKIQKSTFEDGELEFITRPDGSVQIVKNGSVLGYTTQDGIGNAQTATSATTGAETEELHTSLSSGEIAGTVASMATLGTGAVAGSTTTGDATVPADAAVPTDTTAIDPGFSGNAEMTSQNFTSDVQVNPGTHYAAKPYSLSEQEKNELKALVAGEDSYSYEGALAVTSAILNRCESPKWAGYGGSDVMAQAKYDGQFAAWDAPITQACLQDSSKIPSFVDQAVEDCLNGTRNHEFTSFRANTNDAPGRVQIGENGNYYFN